MAVIASESPSHRPPCRHSDLDATYFCSRAWIILVFTSDLCSISRTHCLKLRRAMMKVIDIIDVDELPEPSSEDSDIVFTGFKRDASKSKTHTEQLDTEGLVYVGFKEPPKQKPPDRDAPRRPTPSSSKTPESDEPSSVPMVQRDIGARSNVSAVESTEEWPVNRHAIRVLMGSPPNAPNRPPIADHQSNAGSVYILLRLPTHI
ncbi:hypothetical protein GY45DRAFT_567305 [Cubamyces sp. BRFM 1775]|nr:hypothetical protein GY45DRAFT_567305 [Cubamyces sp. BRFM 1775]